METLTVEVFRTTVNNHQAAGVLIALLRRRLPQCRISIDVEDCDKVLRVEGDGFTCEELIQVVSSAGFSCSVLDY